MSKKKLLINLPEPFFKHEMLKSRFEALEGKYELTKTSCNVHEEIRPYLPEVDAILMWSWPVFEAYEFDIAKNLKFLAQINTTKTTATEVLKRNVELSEARHSWSPAVSEMALTLILNGLRRVSQHHMDMRQGTETWVDLFPTDIDPRERRLTGRTVGVVGFGKIGQGLAELLAPFKVKLKIFDPYLPKEVADKYGAELSTVEDICSGCEIIVLCAANTSEAEKTINATHIASMQKDAVLVNVGRSMLIDMDALLERLKKNDMVAMIDVFDHEPLEADSPFRSLPNAYLTPHRAGGIMETVTSLMDMLTEDMDAFFAGQPRKYTVTEKMLNSFPE